MRRSITILSDALGTDLTEALAKAGRKIYRIKSATAAWQSGNRFADSGKSGDETFPRQSCAEDVAGIIQPSVENQPLS